MARGPRRAGAAGALNDRLVAAITVAVGLSPERGTGHTRGMADVLCPVVVGRDAELGALRAALSAAADGAGSLVFLTGEAGIGKSRLVREVAGDARARDVAVAAGGRSPAASAPRTGR